MSEVRRPDWTLESFLAWEADQEFKWEFDGVAPVAMTGGTIAHATIQGNIIQLLNNRLGGSACRAFGPELKVLTGRGVRYLDGVVTCSPRVPTSAVCPDPVVIFEVLSPSTAAIDRTIKMVEYRSLPSLRHYIMLEQDQVFATVIGRDGDGWRHQLLGRDGGLSLPEVGVELPAADLYDGLELPQPMEPSLPS